MLDYRNTLLFRQFAPMPHSVNNHDEPSIHAHVYDYSSSLSVIRSYPLYRLQIVSHKKNSLQIKLW